MTVAVRIPDDVVSQAVKADCLAVARQLGARLKEVARHEFAGPCPACGGTDRFSVNTDKNIFHCRQSGAAGSPIDLWRYVTGDGFPAAVAALTGYTVEGTQPSNPQERPVAQHQPPPEDNPFRQKVMKEAYDLWRSARPAGEIIRAYFAARAIPFPGWHLKTIREVPNLAYWHKSEATGATTIIHRGPAMVAAITGPDGRFVGLHRTWVDPSRPKGKAQIVCPDTGEILPVKKVLGSMRCGAVSIRPAHPDEGEQSVCVVGEGIETVLSYDAIKDTPRAALWSAVSIGNLAGKAADRVAHPSETFVTKNNQTRRRKVPGPTPDFDDDRCLSVPPDYDFVILLGDGDSDPFATHTAMRRAKARHEVAGASAPELRRRPPLSREVQVDFAPAGKDWNDVLMESAE